MLTCKEASRLASKQLDVKLTWRERSGLWLYIAMCNLCRRYVRDLKNLQIAMRKIGKSGESLLPRSVKLSEQARIRIRQELGKAFQQNDL